MNGLPMDWPAKSTYRLLGMMPLMPLPTEIAAGLYINGISGLTSQPKTKPRGDAYSQISGAQVTQLSAWYHGAFLPAAAVPRRPALQVTDADPRNFLFVGNIENGVAVGILPALGRDVHVYSDNYGGCEWHVLSSANKAAAAFLHVFKDSGALAQYNLGGDWTQRGVLQSSAIATQVGYGSSIVSYAFVANGSNTAECCFLVLNNQGMVTAVHQQTTINL